MLDRLDRLPAPQQDALGVAFGLRAGDAPDRFLVGLAVLSLLAEMAVDRPLVCVVDDAQWLDRASAQALAFVARRLLAESVVLLLATREPGDELEGLPRLVVEGLRNGDARALLGSVVRGPLDDRVRERIVAETHGNPLALLELPRGLTPAELAGGFGLLDAPGLSGRIEESFRRRLASLSAETQRLFLVAAADPVGDPVLVWRAADLLGIGVQAAAETDGLLAIGARVTFRHPLVRSSVYRAASPEERQAVHRALADATDPEIDPDRHAWHLAQATPGLDETVASELERSAGRAQARGGLAAAAAFLERASALTLEPSSRARRALAAAQAKHHAGAFDAALRLVGIAESGPLNDLQRAQVELLRGQIAFSLGRGSDAQPLLLKAAKRLEPLDRRLARETYLEALSAVFFPGLLASGESVLETAQAARVAPPPSQPPHASDLLLDGLAVLVTEGYAAGTPMLRRAVNAFRAEDIRREQGHRWLSLASRVAAFLWDDEAWDAGVNRLHAVGVGGAELVGDAVTAAEDDRDLVLAARHVADVGGVVDDLVDADPGEAPGHELDDGSQAHAGSADAQAREGGFGDGRVDDALGPVFFEHSFGDFISAVVLGDFLAHEEDVFVAVHFLGHGVAEGVSELEGWHGDSC